MSRRRVRTLADYQELSRLLLELDKQTYIPDHKIWQMWPVAHRFCKALDKLRKDLRALRSSFENEAYREYGNKGPLF